MAIYLHKRSILTCIMSAVRRSQAPRRSKRTRLTSLKRRPQARNTHKSVWYQGLSFKICRVMPLIADSILSQRRGGQWYNKH
jgi:hypothetical protein